MKIIAVIAACEGSSTLPNKNIRIVNGKPLIYYVINNALKSHYIDDIIVTTNSTEIVSIARQMGVAAKLRNEALCNENVPLDAVVYDVFKDNDINQYDYVITMQSISPTLKVETLDKAIESCLKYNYDTLISVIATQKFYWRRCKNDLYPLQENRVSRAKLSPLYAEVGAFFITKKQFVKNDSRMGKDVHLYELNEDEAVDVYCFGDLKQVENILCKKSTAIYVNGDNSIGLGHVYRVMQLSDELFTKPDIYYDQNITDKAAFGTTQHNLIPVDGVGGLFDALKHRHYDIFINDILSTELLYMLRLKQILPNAKFVNFEDEGSGASVADIVFNALYETKSGENMKVGAKYFIASKLFLLHEPIPIQKEVKNVFISFGGADPQNYTDRVLRIISNDAYRQYYFYVVIGKAKKHVNDLLRYNAKENIKVLYNIDNMADIMSLCDIAITSRGRTGFELAFLGIPTISIAQNLREMKHDFLNEKNGFMYLGINPEDSLIQQALDLYVQLPQNKRQELQNKMLATDLRNGRKNVVNTITSL